MAQDLPHNSETEQPDLTGMPLIYNDKTVLVDEVAKQNQRWEEAGRKSRQLVENQEQPLVDATDAELLLIKLASKNQEMFTSFLNDAKTTMMRTLEQTTARSSNHEIGQIHPSPHALLDRWYIRFEAYKHNIEHAQTTSDATKFRNESYNDAIATLFDIAMEMSRLIATVESN